MDKVLRKDEMKKIKWGIMGTAYICERSTFQGMMLAKNCEMYAIAEEI